MVGCVGREVPPVVRAVSMYPSTVMPLIGKLVRSAVYRLYPLSVSL